MRNEQRGQPSTEERADWIRGGANQKAWKRGGRKGGKKREGGEVMGKRDRCTKSPGKRQLENAGVAADALKKQTNEGTKKGLGVRET